jgi:membrane protein CcdC involved in cytochrome C biogenesis
MHVLLLYLVSLIYLWLPCMQITGFRAVEALQYSHRLFTPVKWKILGGQILFLLFAEGLICLCAVFVPGWLVFTVLTTALYTILLLIFIVRMQIAYFDRDQIERADLKKY